MEIFKKFSYHSEIRVDGLGFTTQRRGSAETQRRIINMKENEISGIIVDTAVNIHKKLGSGLLENVYEVILAKLLA